LWLALALAQLTSLKTGYWLPNTSDELVRPREPIGQPYMKEGLGAELSARLTCRGYGNEADRAAAQRRTTWLINLKWSTKAPVCPGNSS